MSEQQSSGRSPFSHITWATVSRAFVTSAITPDVMYENKTAFVVLAIQDESASATVWRKSSRVKGLLSRDVNAWTGEEWKHREKDPLKGPSLPFPPPNTICTLIEGVKVFTVQPLTADEENRLRMLVTARTKG